MPISAFGLNLPQDTLNSNVEKEVIEREEEEVIVEFDSNSDSNISSPQLSEDEEMDSDIVVPSTLKTRNGGQIKAVVRLD